jgi:hypothetical protein
MLLHHASHSAGVPQLIGALHCAVSRSAVFSAKLRLVSVLSQRFWDEGEGWVETKMSSARRRGSTRCSIALARRTKPTRVTDRRSRIGICEETFEWRPNAAPCRGITCEDRRRVRRARTKRRFKNARLTKLRHSADLPPLERLRLHSRAHRVLTQALDASPRSRLCRSVP